MPLPMLRALARGGPVALLVLAACDTVDLGPTPADVGACRPSPQFFIDQIWPNFLAKDYAGKRCYDSRCHDASSGRLLSLTVPTTQGVLPLPPDWDKSYRSATAQMQCTNVLSSALLTHPDGALPHGGGMLIAPDGPEAMLVEMWVSAP